MPLAALVIFTLIAWLSSPPAAAQSWWPFGGDDEPRHAPVPREPVYRQPPPVPAPIPGQPPAPGAAPAAQNWSTKNPICLQLEQRLVQEGQKGNQSAQQLPRIEAEMREIDRAFNVGSQQLDRTCYEYFLFTKSFRNTPQCKELAKQVEVSKRRLADLETQRQGLASGRSYQDDIVRELARNNCGANYVDQARRRDGGVWSDEEAVSGNTWTPNNTTGGETFKTVCVRLCDGFYFPVSFATLPSHFAQDAEVCTSKCAAPTELYYHANPGGAMEQAIALQSSEPYTKLKSAFRYRKEYVNGCSCKEAEFVPPVTAEQKSGDASTATGSTSRPALPARRAEVPAPDDAADRMTTGSTSSQHAPPSHPQSQDAATGWATEAKPAE